MPRKPTPAPEHAQAFVYRTSINGAQALRIHGYASRGDVVEVVQAASKTSRKRVSVGWARVGELLARVEYTKTIVTTAYLDGGVTIEKPGTDSGDNGR
jgi:hypothetical protein